MTATTTLRAYHLRVRAEAQEPLQLREHTGSSLRGAFVETMWGSFCRNKEARTCTACPFMQICPVSNLVAPIRDERPRIRDIPRPFAIRPPVGHTCTLRAGDSFTFGLTIYGTRLDLFPYVAMALRGMGDAGIGQLVAENRWRRGRFCVQEVRAANPLTGEEKVVQRADSAQIAFPDLATSWADAQELAELLSPDQITLHLMTPLRLLEHRQLVRRPLIRPLVARLLERYDFLAQAYGGTPFEQEERKQLIAQTDQVAILSDQTRWTTVRSYSRRQDRAMHLDGLTGKVTYRGNLKPLLPIFVWGTIMQVGKAATKGNGVYEIE